MTLSSGASLGPYQIVSPLGAGGMGEVYRARDSRLERDVAVKVLPAALAQDKERILRFEREAKLLATLNHPNIAAIYGFEELDGKKLLAMEYVEGETLSQRLKRGPLPIEEALETGKQIAEAFEAAHEKGIIHRDLKPGNVIVRPDGAVKVLDFGLARAMTDEASGAVAVADSPTITAHYTRPGVVLGTAAYMSPEQARGRVVDRRSDIWSFGCVLFECLTGAGPFAGETTTDVIAKIMEREPDYNALPERTPPRIRDLLHRCLEKQAKRRLRDIGDAQLELDQAIAKREWSTAVIAVGGRATQPARKLVSIAAVLGMLLATGYAGWWWGRRAAGATPPSSADPVPSLIVTSLEQLTDAPGVQSDPCLSPDGKMLLYVSRDGDDLDVFLQRVGGANPINLTADCPVDDSSPAFSPDGNRIAFRSQREGGGLFVMGATGESPQRVSDDGFDPAWSPDGTQLVYATEAVDTPYGRNSISRLSILQLDARKTRLLYRGDAVDPSFSPSGRLVTFWASIKGIRDIWTMPSSGGDPQPVTNDMHTDWNPFFSADGRTLYFISDRSGRPNLWRVPIDEASGKVLGPPLPVTSGTTSIDEASVSSDGQRVTCSVQSQSTEFLRFTFDPVSERIVGEPTVVYASSNPLHQFDVTADGRRLVFRTASPKEDIVVMNMDGTGRRRLMDDMFRNRGPRWTPDGEWLVFYSNRAGPYNIWRIRPDGTDLRRLTAAEGDEDPTNPQVSPDGRTIVASLSTEDATAMVTWNLDRPIPEIENPLALPAARTPGFSPVCFSPNQRWLAGTSDTGDIFNAAISLYDTQSGATSVLRSPDGKVVEGLAIGLGGMDWIDEHRLLVWDKRRRSAFVWDTQTGSAREVPGIPGPCDLRIVDNGRALFVSRWRKESDIWMLQLGEVGEK
jgi:Tol biopolymer transport system component/predicted Ser/Thr protein kinase